MTRIAVLQMNSGTEPGPNLDALDRLAGEARALGASYALSLALANPGLVRGAVAIAPGFHVEPGAIDPAQRLFIAHSPEDRVLSFAYSRDRIAASLRSAGFDPAFHSYRGGHAFDPEAVRLGIDHALGAGGALR